ncbi:MAG: aminotransferase class IV, partial [Patescibacteria group bacterium]
MTGPKKYCYLNGKIVPFSQAKVSVNDIGLTRGFGVSEFLRSDNGKIFLLNDHVRRFFKSAYMIGLKPSLSKESLGKAIQSVLKKNGGGNAQIRVIMTGGDTISGIEFDKKKPMLFILVEHFVPLSGTLYRNGGKLITYEYQRTIPEAKMTNYIAAVSLQKKKKKEKAVEILFVHRGLVREASTSNIFMFKGSNLVTPYDGVLLGITRGFVLTLAKPVYHAEER